MKTIKINHSCKVNIIPSTDPMEYIYWSYLIISFWGSFPPNKEIQKVHFRMLSALEFPIFFSSQPKSPIDLPLFPMNYPFPTVLTIHPQCSKIPRLGKTSKKLGISWRNCRRRVLRFGFGRGDLAKPSEFLEWIVRWSLLGWVWDSQRWESGRAHRAGIRAGGLGWGEVWRKI